LLRSTHLFVAAVREILHEDIARELVPVPLTCAQYHLLRLMALDEYHQLREVADLLGVSPPAATKNVDKLERLGLVVRNQSKGDRRATLLSISPAGRQLVHDFEEGKSARIAPLLARARPGEIDDLCQQLERFALSLLMQHRSESACCLRCAAHFEENCPVGRARGGCPYQRIRDAQAARDAESIPHRDRIGDPAGGRMPLAADDDRKTGNV
jgi:DNA-binding MarR family transcriptional regulator